MKRIYRIIVPILLALGLLSGCAASSAIGTRRMNKTAVNNLVNRYSNKKGFDVTGVGSMGLSLIKMGSKMVDLGDVDTRKALKLLDGLKSVRVVDYSAANETNKNNFNRKMQRYLGNTDVIFEEREGDDITRVYGVVPSDGSKIQDVVVYNPSESMLICLFGKFDIDELSKIFK